MTTNWRPTLLCLLALAAPHHAWGQDRWMLLSRETGCVGLDILARMERLAHAPPCRRRS